MKPPYPNIVEAFEAPIEQIWLNDFKSEKIAFHSRRIQEIPPARIIVDEILA